MSEIFDEKKTINLLKRGDQKAFDSIFNKYKNKIFGFLINMGVNREDAQDLTQETFIKVIKNIDQHNSNKCFSSWLYTIAINCLKDFRKKRTTYPLDDCSIDFVLNDLPEDIIIKKDEKRHLHEIIKKMPYKFRIVLLLRYTNDLSYQEIAHILNISVNNVSADLHRAKKMLKTLMNERKGDYYELSK
ncbi:RNA polymerase sigma-70 factor, ECF subfamily [Paenibacillus tianmuensis]|uniref:RNA polymerase sigma factor n=1 Tax=Paenibacillus tianmuensis TaxID=624147 RepID=A0A1G4TCI4_9BACL|nr:sigma-70 family RNA polymerase sigma factor [Paenibacillus tianmuensis]SCW79018.1 RNA polymerase sigma-70 factor, ECF subfamily [Paenibacillus tianmuensis]